MGKRSGETYDVLVVGGGIAGLSAAYHLAKAGKRVALFDRERMKSGASFNSTAITSHDFDPDWNAVIRIFGQDGARELWQLSERAFGLLADFSKDAVPGFRAGRLPAHIYTTSPEREEALREQYALYRSLGADAEFREDGSALHPNFLKVLTSKTEGESNNQAILKALAHALRRLGGKIFTDTPIVSLSTESGNAKVVAKNGETFTGTCVVVATGDNSLLPELKLPVSTRRTFVVQFEKKGIPDLFKSAVLWDNEAPYHYLRSFRGKFLWIGGEDVDESAYDASVDHYKPLEAYARRVLQWDESYKRVGEWSGTFYNSAIGVPYIGQVQNGPLYVSLGFGDTGVLMTFVSGYLLAEWMEGREKGYQRYFAIGRPQ